MWSEGSIKIGIDLFHYWVKHYEEASVYGIDEGRIFEKIEQRRTRAKCRELQTQRLYLFPGVYIVKKHNTA